jgi:hypothetical protein
MADKKISELNSLTGANAANGDLVAIVDVSATETKKITRSEFFKSVPSIDGGIVFNEGGGDVDFRIESDINSNALFLQGSDGYVGLGTGSPAEKLEVTGNIILDATDANIKIKSGVAGTAGAVNFTFNSDSTVYGSLSFPYDTRTSVGLLAQSANAYPVSIASGTTSNATNAVILSTSGEEAMRVDYLRRVGIGTSSPAALLDVNGAAEINDTLLISRAAVAPKITFENSSYAGGDGGIGYFNSGALVFDANAAERVRITAAGYVGIGDSAPPTILSVRGDTPESRITNTNTISDTGGTEEVARLGVYGQKNGVYGPAANIVFRQDAATWSSADAYHKGTRIEFCTQDPTATDTSETPRMVINKIGNVGIGTSTPTQKLHLSQDSAFAIQMQRTGASPAVCEISNSGSLLNISQNVTGIVFLTGSSPTEKMRITAAGQAIIPGGVTLGTAAGTYNAANTLDDYEEGTWTPAFTPATGAFGSIGYLYSYGSYTKVGRLVTVVGRIQADGTTITIGTADGRLQISGLPFTTAASPFVSTVSFATIEGWSNNLAPSSAYVNPSTTYVSLNKRAASNTNETAMTAAELVSAGTFSGLMFSAIYYTA